MVLFGRMAFTDVVEFLVRTSFAFWVGPVVNSRHLYREERACRDLEVHTDIPCKEREAEMLGGGGALL